MSWKNLSESLLMSASQCWFSKVPTSQTELVTLLKQSNLLKTEEIAKVMEANDRKSFAFGPGIYENKPLTIGNNEVMTTPSTHAITLELLFPFIKTPCKILDIGCGTGYLSYCLSMLNPNGNVLGVDFHKGLIAKAQSLNTHNNLTFRQCDAFEVIEDDFNIVNVGFAASEELYKNLVEKVNNGVLLCPVARNRVVWVLNFEGGEQELGEVGFSEMRVPQNFKVELESIEETIKKMYFEVEQRIGKRPNIGDLPSEIHEILRKRRVLQAKAKRFGSPQPKDNP